MQTVRRLLQNQDQIVLILGISYLLIGSSLTVPVYAQNSDRPLPNNGSPDGTRTPGGTRPAETLNCPETEHPLTAIIPLTGGTNTAVENPTLWVYNPFTDVSQIELTLLDEYEKKELYNTQLEPPKLPGITSVSISDYNLEADTIYRWYLTWTIICNVNSDAASTEEVNFILDSWIHRTPRDSAYRWDRVWYDTLTNTALGIQSSADDTRLHEQWVELLTDEAVNLDYLIDQPFVQTLQSR
ncbi:MAG: DUF928 domain-containing protein [Cyanobacteria bacterium P01_F01_bin.150]